MVSRSVCAQLQSRRSPFLHIRSKSLTKSISLNVKFPIRVVKYDSNTVRHRSFSSVYPGMEGVHVQCLTLLGFSHTCKRQRQLAPGFGTYVYCKLYGYQAFQEMKHNQRQSVPLTVKKCHQLASGFCTSSANSQKLD